MQDKYLMIHKLQNSHSQRTNLVKTFQRTKVAKKFF